MTTRTSRRTHSRSGFTLIELLVVISIIALLIALLLPALANAKATARQSECLTLIKQFALADQMYAGDNRSWVVPAHASFSWVYNDIYASYLNSTGGWFSDETPPGWQPERMCPDAINGRTTANWTGRPTITFSYGMNTQDWWDRAVWSQPQGFFKLEMIANPTEVMRMYDSILWFGHNARRNTWKGDAIDAYVAGWSDGGVAYRHPNRAVNMNFLDGHAATVLESDFLANYTRYYSARYINKR